MRNSDHLDSNNVFGTASALALDSRMRSGASAYFIIIGYGALALSLIGGRLPGWFRSQFDTGLSLNPSIDVMCQSR
jgi:hypothetical protein